MSAVLDRLTAVVLLLKADMANLQLELSAAQSASGTSDAVLEPIVADLEALHASLNPATIPAPPPAE